MSDDSPETLDQLRVLKLLEAALDRPVEERDPFLVDACGADRALLDRVRELLSAQDQPDSLLDRPAANGVTLSQALASDDPETWKEFLDQVTSDRPTWERYEDRGEIARGGMGAIHLVHDQDLRRTLAMKILLKNDGPDPTRTQASLGRFLEEAQVTSQLDHPGIVPVHEIGRDEQNRTYFTMKLVKGEDLRAVFDRVHDPHDDEWNETRALNTLLRVCEAMAYAHEKGVIHRDLKPGNVMVGRHGETYVMDWGVARLLSEEGLKRPWSPKSDASGPIGTERRDAALESSDSEQVTMAGGVVGTPSYMPLEQALGQLDEMGPHSDVYAVGAMLYHLLTGQMPYVDDDSLTTAWQILERVQSGPPTPIHELRRNVPAELISICDRAMARRVDERYPSMLELGRDLRAYLENRVVEAYESGALAQLKKWVVRNRGIAATAVAALVLIAALTAWFVLNLAEKQREASARKAEFDQLAGMVLLENALEKEGEFYPATPATADAMEAWLAGDAAKLLGLRPTLARTLAELKLRAQPAPRGETSDDSVKRFELESEQFLHDTLSDLDRRIDAFESGVMAEVAQRLSWARRIDELTRDHPNATSSWADARSAIAAADGVTASERYAQHRIDLQPQRGLVPIGMNPVTRLWEFYDLRTAFDPATGQDPGSVPIPKHREDGTLEVTGATGLVFVLIPGGSYGIGSQAFDEAAPHHDPRTSLDESPVHRVSLSPYFLSRYEMTQGQWLRIAGDNPSNYGADGRWSTNWDSRGRQADRSHPVEQVSWDDCVRHLARVGLVLPTEAQWEAACRAGTETPWWTGGDLAGLDQAGNLSDQYGKTHGNESRAAWEQDLDDGSTVHARVGSYRANPFGLHDVIGNVWEWCLDDYAGYDQSGRAGDGARSVPGAPTRVYRGGSFDFTALYARSANRSSGTPAFTTNLLGCRPARVVE